MAWMMTESSPSVNLWMTLTYGEWLRQKMADLVQRYFDKLEVGGSRNLRRLNKNANSVP